MFGPLIFGGVMMAKFFEQDLVTVMSFNLRYASAPDGENSWIHRRESVMSFLVSERPTFLGVQEAEASQIDDIRRALPDYGVVGVGRDDGLRKGEFSALFYRIGQAGMVTGGTRWISATPEKIGSVGPGATLPRIFTWGDFVIEGGRRLTVVNTHWDHQSASARLLGAHQVRAWIESGSGSAVVMGDLNCTMESEPVRHIVGGELRLARPNKGPYLTFQGFDAEKTEGEMIDHIFFAGKLELQECRIDRTLRSSGRPLSDHYPVIAAFTFKD